MKGGGNADPGGGLGVHFVWLPPLISGLLQQPLHTPYHAFIHPRSIADSWTAAGPWTEWHGTDMTMHIGKMPGDKTKEP
jgi:hypothetical protein